MHMFQTIVENLNVNNQLTGNITMHTRITKINKSVPSSEVAYQILYIRAWATLKELSKSNNKNKLIASSFTLWYGDKACGLIKPQTSLVWVVVSTWLFNRGKGHFIVITLELSSPCGWQVIEGLCCYNICLPSTNCLISMEVVLPLLPSWCGETYPDVLVSLGKNKRD